jgi:phosphonate transport system substrate-binding protein
MADAARTLHRAASVSAKSSKPMKSICFATFLAPSLLPVYRFITRYLARRLACPTKLLVGSSYKQMLHTADAGFVCGLAYVELVRRWPGLLVPLAAPILRGERYEGKAVYFSDVIVHRNSPFKSFRDLRGCSWCYNEKLSQSGFGITRYHLASMNETLCYFGKVITTGYHQRSIRLVSSGLADATSVDSQVLTLALVRRPELASQLRIIDSLGPSTIQPIVASRRLPKNLRRDMRAALTEMHQDPQARERLSEGLIDRFVPVSDGSYNDIRLMQATADAAARSQLSYTFPMRQS